MNTIMKKMIMMMTIGYGLDNVYEHDNDNDDHDMMTTLGYHKDYEDVGVELLVEEWPA